VDPARSALAKTEPRGSLESSVFSLRSPPISPNASVEAESGGGGSQGRLRAGVENVLELQITLGNGKDVIVRRVRVCHNVDW